MSAARGSVLGVDPGSVRIGLAVSDPDGLVATPAGTLPGGDGAADRIAAEAAARGCATVVVGLPRALSGRDTAATRQARDLAAALQARGLTVALWDERLTSVEADRMLVAAGRNGRQRRTERDRVAAALLLQGWLDHRGR